MDFTIDEYEKSTKEFEKYVNTIPKKVPLKLIKSNTISSLVKDYYQKSEFSDTEELIMLSEILCSLQNWGNPPLKKPSPDNSSIIMLCAQHKDLSKRLENVSEEIKHLTELVEFKISEANGFTSEEEISEVISVLNSKIMKLGIRHKEAEKIDLQIQELEGHMTGVRLIQEMTSKIEDLEEEKESLVRSLEKISRNYEEMISTKR